MIFREEETIRGSWFHMQESILPSLGEKKNLEAFFWFETY